MAEKAGTGTYKRFPPEARVIADGGPASGARETKVRAPELAMENAHMSFETWFDTNRNFPALSMAMNAGESPTAPEAMSGVRGSTSVNAPVVELMVNIEMSLMSWLATYTK
jgi:hypothetical protein